MRGFLLQDWKTIRGNSGASGPLVTSIPQGADNWLDLGEYEDVVVTLDCAEWTNSNVQLAYETSPTRQDASFVAMRQPFAPAVGRTVERIATRFSAVPPARYLRWRLTCSVSGTYDLTFRIWIAAYAWVQ